jgi:hypothetical protein
MTRVTEEPWHDGRTRAGRAVRAARAESILHRDLSRVISIDDGRRWYYGILPESLEVNPVTMTLTFQYLWFTTGEIRSCTLGLEKVAGYQEVTDAPAESRPYSGEVVVCPCCGSLATVDPFTGDSSHGHAPGHQGPAE